jgi:RND family efflux transporter MFP subunit
MATDISTPDRPSSRTLKIAGLIALAIALAVVVVGLLERNGQTRALKSWTTAEAIPTVDFVHPVPATAGQTLTLPGSLAAFNDAQLYARVPGYVHGWYVDIGAAVKKGQTLALIDTPELDQQIAQARADLVSAKAGAALSLTTANRWKGLLAADAVSQQETEEKIGDLDVKTAAVKAAQANLQRLNALKSFARVTAPFEGVVTSRTADIGALVNAGSGASTPPLFTVADISRIRVYVRVPQEYSADVKPGAAASFTLPEYPGRTFSARVATTSDAINDQSGALLVELETPNVGEQLKPGDYAKVSFALPGGTGGLTLPASTLLFKKAGLQVATVGPNDRISMKPVKIETDLGAMVRIASGVTSADRVVDNPPDSLAEGDLVRIDGVQAQGGSPQEGAHR